MDTAAAAGPLRASDLDAEGVRVLTLTRPGKANALDLALAQSLFAWITRSAEDGCRALVIDAEGRNFCAGFDFSGLDASSPGDIIDRFVLLEQAFQLLRGAPFVSFALVRGAAFGAGADLALAATYRIGTARARFRFPGFQFGVALGTRHLAKIVGMQTARDILLRNRVVAGEDALALGLLTHLAEEDGLRAVADGLRGEVGPLAPDAIRRIHAMTGGHDDAADLSDLVRSLSGPGLHERIAAYRRAQD